VGIDKGVVVFTYTDCTDRTDSTDKTDKTDRTRDELFSPAESEGDLMSCLSVGSNTSR